MRYRSDCLKERDVKQTIQAATKVTLYLKAPDFDYDQPKLRTIVVTDTATLARMKQGFIKTRRNSNPSEPPGDKCFEGWTRLAPAGAWPHAVFETTRGKKETIWLPEGDCQVWAASLPWGWKWTGEFLREVRRIDDLAFRSDASKK